MGKWALGVALVLTLASPAAAQDTIALYFADPVNGLQRYGTTPAGQFDIVALMKTTDGSTYAEFVMDEITVRVPGMFKVATRKINNSPIDGGDNSLGEYAIDFGGCVEAGMVEVVRVSYLDFGALMPWDFIMEIRGFGPGDTMPSSFDGHAGYVDCQDVDRPLMGEAWPASARCSLPDGACGLNLEYCSPTAAENFSTLKTRY